MFPCQDEVAESRARSMSREGSSLIVRNRRRGEVDDHWHRVAGRDADSMLRSIALREAVVWGLADLPLAAL